MNDYKGVYKGLVEILNEDPTSYWEQRAADVIEYLAKQLDAAVVDIERRCKTCKHSKDNNPQKEMCKFGKVCKIPEHDCWEWRGVQK